MDNVVLCSSLLLVCYNCYSCPALYQFVVIDLWRLQVGNVVSMVSVLYCSCLYLPSSILLFSFLSFSFSFVTELTYNVFTFHLQLFCEVARNIPEDNENDFVHLSFSKTRNQDVSIWSLDLFHWSSQVLLILQWIKWKILEFIRPTCLNICFTRPASGLLPSASCTPFTEC